jgi:hypothetical protein
MKFLTHPAHKFERETRYIFFSSERFSHDVETNEEQEKNAEFALDHGMDDDPKSIEKRQELFGSLTEVLKNLESESAREDFGEIFSPSSTRIGTVPLDPENDWDGFVLAMKELDGKYSVYFDVAEEKIGSGDEEETVFKITNLSFTIVEAAETEEQNTENTETGDETSGEEDESENTNEDETTGEEGGEETTETEEQNTETGDETSGEEDESENTTETDNEEESSAGENQETGETTGEEDETSGEENENTNDEGVDTPPATNINIERIETFNDTREALSRLGNSINQEVVMNIVNERADRMLKSLETKLASLTSPVPEGTWRAIAQEYLVAYPDDLTERNQRTLYRTEMFATVQHHFENNPPANLTASDISEFFLAGMGAVYSYAHNRQTPSAALSDAREAIKYDLDTKAVDTTYWNTVSGGDIRNLAAEMNSGVNASFSGENLVVNGQTSKVLGFEALTGAAMADYNVKYLQNFQLRNLIVRDGTHVLACMNNGCNGNLVAIELETPITPVTPGGTTPGGTTPGGTTPGTTPQEEPVCDPLSDNCINAVVNGVGNEKQRMMLVEVTRDEAEKFLEYDKTMFEALYGKEKKNGKRKKRESAVKHLNDIANNAGFIKGGVVGWLDALVKTIGGADTPTEKFYKQTGLDADDLEKMKEKGALCEKMLERFGEGHFSGEIEMLKSDIALTVIASLLTGGIAVVATNIKTPFFKDLVKVGDLNVIYAGLMSMNDDALSAVVNSDNAYETFVAWRDKANDRMLETQRNLMRGETVSNETLTQNAERNKTTIQLLDEAFDRYEDVTEDKAKQVKKGSFDTFGDHNLKKEYREQKKILQHPDESDIEKTYAAEKMVDILVQELNEDIEKTIDSGKYTFDSDWYKVEFKGLGEGIWGLDKIPLGIKTLPSGTTVLTYSEQRADGSGWDFYEVRSVGGRIPAPNQANRKRVMFDELPKKYRQNFDKLTVQFSGVKNLYTLATNAREYAETSSDLQRITNVQQQEVGETAKENVYQNSIMGFLDGFETWSEFEGSGILKIANFNTETLTRLKAFFAGHKNAAWDENFRAMIDSDNFKVGMANLQTYLSKATFELGDESDLSHSSYKEKIEAEDMSTSTLMSELMTCDCTHAKIYYPDLVGQQNQYVPIILPVSMIMSLFEAPIKSEAAAVSYM